MSESRPGGPQPKDLGRLKITPIDRPTSPLGRGNISEVSIGLGGEGSLTLSLRISGRPEEIAAYLQRFNGLQEVALTGIPADPEANVTRPSFVHGRDPVVETPPALEKTDIIFDKDGFGFGYNG